MQAPVILLYLVRGSRALTAEYAAFGGASKMVPNGARQTTAVSGMQEDAGTHIPPAQPNHEIPEVPPWLDLPHHRHQR